MKKVLVLLFFISALYGNTITDAYYKSYTYESTQQYQNAINALSELYQEYPTGYTLNLRLGYLYFLSGKYANAIHHYSEAIKVAPDSIESRLGLISIYIAQEHFDEAETLAFQILSKDYYNYYGNLNTSIILRAEGKAPLSIDICLKMLTLYPTDINFLSELGKNYLALDQQDNARSIMNSLFILDPENITAKAIHNIINTKD